jgi:F0F1-type ATP synthase membrane subunit b/b'
MIQGILDERKLSIKIACAETGSNGLYSAEIQVLEKPQDMSEEQAQQYIAEARREATTIDGPWVFEGTVTGTGNP